jgi:glutathione-independent formaldehyde dehydrogenase
MKAVVYKGPRQVAVEEVEDPTIQEPTDILVKVTSAAICGSDLHMYEGRTDTSAGRVLGHEIMGVVEEIGDAVDQLQPGDRVVLPFNTACGKCFNCVRGWTNACLSMNPSSAGAAYGYADMGPYRGGQAQKVLVPYGDFNALKLPGKAGDAYEDDFLMLADIFPTAYHATELAKVDMGYSVAIYGAGPVGLLSVMAAKLRGAAHIFCIDYHTDRLQLAEQFGAIPINFATTNPQKFIADFAKQHQAAARPGEEKMVGVLSGIDAVGYQALDFADQSKENHTQVLDDLTQIVEPTGAIGIIGVFRPSDPGGSDNAAKQGIYPIRLGLAWSKSLSIGTGQCPVKRYDAFLREAILAGKVQPGKIVTHHASIDEAPEYYRRFDQRENGVIKIVLKPNN